MPSTFRLSLLALVLIAALTPAATQAQQSAGQLPIEIIPNTPDSAESVAFLPDESLMATGQYDGTIKLVDMATGRLLRIFKRHSKSVTDVTFVAGGKQLLSASDDMTIKLWDITTGRLIRTTELKGSISYFWSIKLSPDGTRALTSTTPNGKYTAEVKLWDVATGRVLRTFQANALKVLFSPDGTRVLAGGGGVNYKPGGQVTLWDVASGRQLRSFEGHKAFSSADRIAISPDGRVAVSSAGIDKDVRLWDLASGRTLRTFFHEKSIYLLAFMPDSTRVITGDADGTLREWSVATGQLVRTIQKNGITSVLKFMRDGARVITKSGDGLEIWDFASTKILQTFKSEQYFLLSAVYAPDGASIVYLGKSLQRWDPKTGQLLTSSALSALGDNTYTAAFDLQINRALWRRPNSSSLILTDLEGGPVLARFDHAKEVHSAVLSPDGSRVASRIDNNMMLWDAATGKLLRTFTHPDQGPAGFKSADSVDSIAFSPDGTRILSGTSAGFVRLWDAASGRLIWEYRDGPASAIVWTLEFSPDGSRVLATIDETPKLLDAATGRLVRAFQGHQSGFITTTAKFSPDGTRMLSSSHDLTTKLWDVATGRLLRSLETGTTFTLAFSPDGRRALLNGVIWDLDTGERLVSILSSGDEWLAITPEGYFAASAKGAAVLSAVRGLESWSIDQFYQSLYRPDLVREKLAGDTRGLVREAAAKLDLNKVLASGNSPTVTLLSPRDGTRATAEQVTAEIEISEKGGGIGRVEWRINGVTVGIETPPAPPAGQLLRLTRGLVLDDGENEIEVVAYNGANLVASVPVRATIAGQAAASRTPARLFVLAVGLNDYAEDKFKLTYAVPDAKALAQALSEAGKGVYESVDVTLVQDADVKRGKLDAVFAELASKVRPSDVFVFFLGGHGKTIDGRYYFIPQDFRIDGTVTKAALDAAVVKQGIAQEEWQAWLARVPARKSVLLFDTCESGSLTGEGKETRALERTAANDRLVQATGRTILTASSDDTDAFEGFRGHGLFTYNVLEALERADTDGNGRIEVAELAAYVYAQVTALSEQLYKQRQVPQVRLTGNYSLAKPAHVLADKEPGIVLPAKATHQVTSAAELLVLPAMGARRVRRLDAKTPVTLVKSDAGWTLIAREGRPLGFVATKDLTPIQ